MPLFQRSRYWITLTILLVGFCGSSVWTLSELRRDTYDIATTNARNLLTVLSRDIETSIRTYNGIIEHVAAKLGDPAITRLSPDLQQKYLFDGVLIEPFFASVLVLDKQGNVVRDAGAYPPRTDNFSDREYFQVHRDGRVEGLFISSPFQRRLTGTDKVVALSRALRNADGTFAGVVVGTIGLDYVRTLFERATLKPGDAINLISTSGVLLMRTPYNDEQIGRDLSGSDNVRRLTERSSGVFSGVAAVDQVKRVYSFTHVEDLPLILNVALEEDAIYAPWRKRAAQIGSVLVLLCAMATGLGFMVRRELSRRARAEEAARRSGIEYRILADNSTDLILRLDGDLTRRYVSPASRKMLGFEPDEMVGRRTRDLIHPDDWPIVERMMAASQASDEFAEAIYRVRHKNGHHVWVEGRYSRIPSDNGFIVVLRDISKRKAAELELAGAHAKLATLANEDGLTGLANRRYFDEALAREHAEAKKRQTSLSLLLLDVDRFKRYNDRQGHQAGDECLRRVAAAISTCTGAMGLCARYGGEELAVILPRMGADAAREFGQAIGRAVETLAIPHDGNKEAGGLVTVSIGCATLKPDPNPAGAPDLVREADSALYEAKRLGRNRTIHFRQMSKAAVAPLSDDEPGRLALVQDVRPRALGKTESLDLIARSAAQCLNMPLAFVSLVGKDEVSLVGRHGVEASEFSRDLAFCSHTITGTEPLVVPDLALDERFAANPLVQIENGPRFYAGAPIIDPLSKHAVGTICVLSNQPHEMPTSSQRQTLMALGATALSVILETNR